MWGKAEAEGKGGAPFLCLSSPSPSRANYSTQGMCLWSDWQNSTEWGPTRLLFALTTTRKAQTDFSEYLVDCQ